ncbi:MAG: restriction endonuclease subunit M [Anaerolinea sp.]|nr:restriction endonuclease subunit M [Anaerolinea sp.]
MPAPEIIQSLVNRFDDQIAAYRAGKYNETQLRRDYLDPFFKALGWDMDNIKDSAEKYREVIHEISVEVEGQAKAADYAFRVGEKAIFLVEAKKPAVNIAVNPEPAFQIKRYGWSAKLPINLLTDFEQLAVYDCRSKPKPGDIPAVGRIKLYHFKDYIDKWDEIAAVFSREAVYKGSFDSFAEGMKGKRGTADVDDEFLAEMERWREDLARNIALRNPVLTTREINAAVQTTIDRIIFLRICEERGIEPEDALRNATDGRDVYQDLMVLFQQADRKYNSGLFHFNAEKNQTSQPDTLTPSIKIDDRVLKDILKHLYYPDSPYAFKYIPADILGSVYERFLGKVIRLTAGHTAKVEEKPEVRKAGGVYYTPTYIVDYIVKNTVGELLKESTAEEQRVKPIRIVDPACGSGSFLLGAYQYLLDWYLNWYSQNDPARWAKGKDPVVFEGRDGWQLTMEEKKGILTRHIFGVDIDAQAVEVTKLSLLLKVVENPGQLSMLDERILPDLGRNIQCGNSLIGPDYYDKQMTMFDEEEQYRVNAFDWHKAFPQVFSAPSVLRTSPPNAGHLEEKGGFDAVIGNPPYIRIQALKEWAPQEVEFYKTEYVSASKGNYDIYVVFVEKGLSLLNPQGRLGFILPHKFFNAQYGAPLRGLISSGKHLAKVVHFGDQQVFDGATTYTCLMFLNHSSLDYIQFEKVPSISTWKNHQEERSNQLLSSKLNYLEWNFSSYGEISVLSKLADYPLKLKDISNRIFQGLITGADSVFIVKQKENGKYYSEATKKEYDFEIEIIHQLCKGSINIRRYFITELEKAILFPYKLIQGKAVLLTTKELSKQYPKFWGYLIENRKILEDREKGKWKHENWYAFGRSQNLSEMEQNKILTPSIANRSSFSIDDGCHYYFVGSGGGGGGGYGITLNNNRLSNKYIVGLLNSKLLDYYLKSISSPFSGGYFAYNRQYIEQLPIHAIDFSNPLDVTKHDRMVALVENMLSLHERLSTAGLPQEKEMLQRQIDTTDRQIDALVYELYGLTAEEIKIVEGCSIP